MNDMRGIELSFTRHVPPLQGGGICLVTCSRPFRPGYPITGFQPVGVNPFPRRIANAEQRRIVSRLDALAAKQAELRRLQTETEALLAAFTPALLAKAFRGEL
jgi:hypothetical protein